MRCEICGTNKQVTKVIFTKPSGEDFFLVLCPRHAQTLVKTAEPKPQAEQAGQGRLDVESAGEGPLDWMGGE